MSTECWPAKHLGFLKRGGREGYITAWVRSVVVGVPSAGIKMLTVAASLLKAVRSRNASQQSIWAFLGGGREGYITTRVRSVLVGFPRQGSELLLLARHFSEPYDHGMLANKPSGLALGVHGGVYHGMGSFSSCGCSLGRDQNFYCWRVAFKNRVITEC